MHATFPPNQAGQDDRLRLPAIVAVVDKFREALPAPYALEERNFRKFSVIKSDGVAYGRTREEIASLFFHTSGEVVIRNRIEGFKFELKEEEKAAIKAEMLEANAKGDLLKSITTTFCNANEELRAKIREKDGVDPTLYIFRGENGPHGGLGLRVDDGDVLFVQQRVRLPDGGKHDLPWTFWSDGVWRQMEGDDELLPLWGIEQLKTNG